MTGTRSASGVHRPPYPPHPPTPTPTPERPANHPSPNRGRQCHSPTRSSSSSLARSLKTSVALVRRLCAMAPESAPAPPVPLPPVSPAPLPPRPSSSSPSAQSSHKASAPPSAPSALCMHFAACRKPAPCMHSVSAPANKQGELLREQIEILRRVSRSRRDDPPSSRRCVFRACSSSCCCCSCRACLGTLSWLVLLHISAASLLLLPCSRAPTRRSCSSAF